MRGFIASPAHVKSNARLLLSPVVSIHKRVKSKMTIQELVTQSHELAQSKGFYELPPNLSEKLMLIVSEIAEACEELRVGHLDGILYTDTGKPIGFPIELADAVIRIADMCGYLGINLEEMINIKHAYNKTRGHKHGKAF